MFCEYGFSLLHTSLTDVWAASKFTNDIWMVVLEHCTPAVLRKVRSLSKNFESMISKFQKLLVECRFQTYGLEIQALPEGLSERQFIILCWKKENAPSTEV